MKRKLQKALAVFGRRQPACVHVDLNARVEQTGRRQLGVALLTEGDKVVLRGIRNLELGVGLVAGFCIVLLAGILDRVSKASLERVNAGQAQ